VCAFSQSSDQKFQAAGFAFTQHRCWSKIFFVDWYAFVFCASFSTRIFPLKTPMRFSTDDSLYNWLLLQFGWIDRQQYDYLSTENQVQHIIRECEFRSSAIKLDVQFIPENASSSENRVGNWTRICRLINMGAVDMKRFSFHFAAHQIPMEVIFIRKNFHLWIHKCLDEIFLKQRYWKSYLWFLQQQRADGVYINRFLERGRILIT